MTNNPWQESTAGPSNGSQPQPHHTINHRLSYDFGSGVIVLPDDGIWLDSVDSDSDVDDEIRDMGSQASPELAAPEDGQGVAEGLDGQQTVNGLSKTRYGTYFHHPERRWQSVPGAFPTGS